MMSLKSEASYTKVFSTINENFPKLCIIKGMSDFEIALMNPMIKVFRIPVTRCYFHFAQVHIFLIFFVHVIKLLKLSN